MGHVPYACNALNMIHIWKSKITQSKFEIYISYGHHTNPPEHKRDTLLECLNIKYIIVYSVLKKSMS